ESRRAAQKFVWRATPAPATPEIDWTRLQSAVQLDAQLRAVAAELASRDLEFGEALEVFFRAEGWRRLGWATAAHYARERLGVSLSFIKDRRFLSRSVRRLPAVARAVREGEIGYEAARLVVGVATGTTVHAWIARAKERTLVHLREEIDAAELVARLTEAEVTMPPTPEVIDAVSELERRV